MSKHGNRNKENVETTTNAVKSEDVVETTAEQTPADTTTDAAAEVTNGANAPEEETGNTDVANGENPDETPANPEVGENGENPSTDTLQEQSTDQTATESSENQTPAKYVEVVCDQLYFRPEPNKLGTPLGVLTKGERLVLVESEDKKLPEGWLEVYQPGPKGLTGYIVKEFVKEV